MTDQKAATEKPSRNTETFAYLTGLITATVIFGLLLYFVGHLVGFSTIGHKLKERLPGYDPYTQIIQIPAPVLQDLSTAKAVFSNAGNPTQQPEHDTILVHPDPVLGYALNPGSRIYADILKTEQPYNIDPPVLYRTQKLDELTTQVQEWLAAESRLSYSYGIGNDGRRNTLPVVSTEKKLLIVGDSVAFGVGVDDADTMASKLQERLGDAYTVVNAGVGGYTGRQVFNMADKLSKEQHYAGLIYIACQNDFIYADDWNTEMRAVLQDFKSLAGRFDHPPIVVLETYLEYSLRDFFMDEGWGKNKLRKTDQLRVETRKQAIELGFVYSDWTDEVSAFGERERSIFAPFALYVDHTHLSPRGNVLMAERLRALITSLPISPRGTTSPMSEEGSTAEDAETRRGKG